MRLGAWISFGLGCVLAAQAQEPSTRPVESEGVKLKVRIKGDRAGFHVGELIPLELSFTSASPNTYQIDTASYDRSGRLGEESFQVEPAEGSDDPLALYFQSYAGFIGGGLRGFKRLSTVPSVIERPLNEWVRFNQPGRYHVVVTSMRANRVGSNFGSQPLEIPTAELWVTIIPATAEWQAATLARARTLLSGQGHASAAEAMSILRYLGTAGAAREMARGLNDPNAAFQYKLGLASTPDRDAALKILDELLHDPDFPVNGLFLDTMSLVALPAGKIENRPERREELETQFRRQLIDALAEKRGKALAVSAYTIIDEAAMHGHDLPADQKQRLTAELVSEFDLLPAQAQTELFQSRWRVLDKKEMLALLPKVAQRFTDFPELREMTAYQANETGAAALMRWWEMDPQAARPAMIKEIERLHPRFGASVLGVLPDKELPEVEQQLADHLTQEGGKPEQTASLISRYATAAIEPAVTGYLDERLGKWACAIQAPLLAYLLRVDPPGAVSPLEKAVAARGKGFSACNHSLFTDIAELHNGPALEDLALRSLADGDPQVVGNAASYLGRYGSTAAEVTLWIHMTAWSRRWKGRESELRYVYGEEVTPAIYEDGAGSAMISALATGQGWLTDETKLNRLLELSVGQNQREQVEQCLKLWRTRPREIQFSYGTQEQFQLAQYSMRSRQMAIEKLSQFPRGTEFLWVGGMAWDGEDNAFDEISKAVTSRGITLTRRSQPPR
jgi:hypothetical protein